MNVGFSFDAQSCLAIFLVGDADVDETEQLAHDVFRGLAVFPEILAVIEVARNCQTLVARGFHALYGHVGGALTDGRSDSRDVEPRAALERLRPVDIARLSERDGAVFAIVDYLGSALISAGLDEIDAHASFASHDVGRVHAETSQFADEGIRDGIIGGQYREIARGQSELRDGDGDIGFTASEGGDELRRLQETLKARRRESEHSFAESDDKWH